MNNQLTLNDMINLKVGDTVRFDRKAMFPNVDIHPLDTFAIVVTPFKSSTDKHGNVTGMVKTSGHPVTTHNYHLFTKVTK
jgi:hypothetical protein